MELAISLGKFVHRFSKAHTQPSGVHRNSGGAGNQSRFPFLVQLR
jgi:hypothetical protein